MIEITSDEQALEIMRRCEDYYVKKDDGVTPEASGGCIIMDGCFTADQLKAFLYFLEKENGTTQS